MIGRTGHFRLPTYGPDTSTTRYPSFDGVVFLKWGSAPGTPYVGRLSDQVGFSDCPAFRRGGAVSLADEAAGPIANLLTVPQDGGDGEDGDPLKMLKADLRTARGKALLLGDDGRRIRGWAERGTATGLGSF